MLEYGQGSQLVGVVRLQFGQYRFEQLGDYRMEQLGDYGFEQLGDCGFEPP